MLNLEDIYRPEVEDLLENEEFLNLPWLKRMQTAKSRRIRALFEKERAGEFVSKEEREAEVYDPALILKIKKNFQKNG